MPIERPQGTAGTLTSRPRTVRIDDGREAEVEAGTFLVAERRERDTGRVISIPFYRVHCPNPEPAAPIFMLAGGPGSSWIDLFGRAGNFEGELSSPDTVLVSRSAASPTWTWVLPPALRQWRRAWPSWDGVQAVLSMQSTLQGWRAECTLEGTRRRRLENVPRPVARWGARLIKQ